MVASLSALKSVSAVAGYYSQVDDYYRSGDMSPTQWSGRGAQSLGLRDEVDTAIFTAMLRGHLPDGEQLGRPDGKGGIEHRPGWDLTFSAPKSVSVLALAGGDERLIRAHEAAVAAAIAHIERTGAAHQIHGQNPVASENLVVAQFRHATSREQQPQLHTHAVILNCTQDADGRWRSVESRPLFRLQTEAGVVYRSELARQCRELGYDLTNTRVGKEPGFEIRGVPETLLAHWSERSHQVEAALAAQGQTRASASAAAKEAATLSSRARKGEIDHATLRHEWRETAHSFGAELDLRIEQARANTQHSRMLDPELVRDIARAAITLSSEKLVERHARFSTRELLNEARKIAFGKVTDLDLRAGVSELTASGQLIFRQTRAYDPVSGRKEAVAGFTTPEAIAQERALLANAQRMIGNDHPICRLGTALDAIKSQELRSGHAFNQSQRSATIGVLTTGDRLQLIQGFAGTAKTTSVLATLAAELTRQGQVVCAMAPTASAAQTLAAAIGIEGMTVARHLLEQERGHNGAGRETWMVDEASLLSTRDMNRLLTLAEMQQARVILVGDIKQIGSVGAGAAFQQLQEHPRMQVHVLDQIVRQRNDHVLGAVEASIRGCAREALQSIDHAGVVQRHAERSGRIGLLVRDYLNQTADDRAKSLVIALGRDDRHEINVAIRQAMQRTGALHGPAVSMPVLISKDLTHNEARRAESYGVGDCIRFARDYRRLGIAKGEYATITGIDAEQNRLTAQTMTGQVVSLNPRIATKTEVFEMAQREVQVGEQLRLTRNDRDLGRTNGQNLVVEKIDGMCLHVRDAQGKLQVLEAGQWRDSHVEHAYCSTAHAAQGQTADRVFVHAESFRPNLVSQQSFYVVLSRARDEVRIYTDDRERLIAQVERESGEKSMALDPSERVTTDSRQIDSEYGKQQEPTPSREYDFALG